MKKILLAFCLLLASITNLFSQDRGFKTVNVKIGNSETTLYTESHALIIGMSEYTNGWNNLAGVKKDIVEVASVLKQNGFHVIVKENMTKETLDKAFSDFIAKYGQGKDNRLLFYFAGHGFTVNTSYGDKLGYIVPINAPNPNTDLTGFQATAMEMAQIEIYAKRIQSKHALFLFDACFAGSLFAVRAAVPSVINYKTKKPVRQFITSGSADESVPDKSIFREQFITALSSKSADLNKDGYLTGTELGMFLQNQVINYSYSNQHPQYGKIRHKALDKGDFVFVLHDEIVKKSAERISSYRLEKAINAKKKSKNIAKPSLGNSEILTYGSISIETDIAGTLYLDGHKLGYIKADTRTPINKVLTGERKLEIRGAENWEGNVVVRKNRLTKVSPKHSEEHSEARVNQNFTVNEEGIEIEMYGIASVANFLMGNMEYDKGSETIPHLVRLDSFAIMRYEVTQDLWYEVMGFNPSRFKGDKLPVENVSWKEVQKFITKLNKRTHQHWRLPTEAEWEYAAKGGEAYKYSGSNKLAEVGWHSHNSKNGSHFVGQKKPNAFGLYDMSGNVWEWCSDWYDADYYKRSPINNPKGAEDGLDRVVRGGSWYDFDFYHLTYFRRHYGVYDKNFNLGFRLVQSL